MRLSPNHKLAILCALVAIPTAIVVWSKATSKDGPGTSRHSDDDDDEGPDPLARYAREQKILRDEKLAEEHKAKARAAVIAALFADGRPGAPGAVFAGLALDRAWSADAIRARLDGFRAETGAAVTILPDEISVFVPPPPGGRRDDSVMDAAVHTWGPPEHDRWLDEADHVRATIASRPSGTTVVTWQRSMSATDLFPSDPAIASTFIPTVGGAAATTLPLGSHANPTPTGYDYVLPGLEWSSNAVRIEVDVDAPLDVVTAIHIHTGALSDDELRPLRLALRDRYGKPGMPERPDGYDGGWRVGRLRIDATLKRPDGLVIDLTQIPR